MLFGFVVLAFLPVIAVDYILDSFVRSRETAHLQAIVDGVTRDSQVTVQSGTQSLRRILAASPSLCAATFMDNVSTQLRTNPYLRNVIVENRDGVQYCSAYGTEARYRVLSEQLAIPGHTETLSVVIFSGDDTPMLKISQQFGNDRQVAAFIIATPVLAHSLIPMHREIRFLQLALTSGTPILSLGESAGEMATPHPDYLFARSFAGEIPLKAEAWTSFEMLRAQYGQLDASFTVLACFLGALMLIMALKYVRGHKMRSFELERAILAGEFKPYYQPVMSLKTGKLIGCEVLIRWVKKSGEVIPPGAFIDHAESSGLAIPMTLSLMEQVRVDLEEFCRQVPDFKVSINLFEGHFRDGSIVNDIQSIFEGSGIAYRQLVFEITERNKLDDRTAINRIISSMHKLGVRIAMDDAGTGHSNLAYLQTLGIDMIKIDKIFVDMIADPITPVPVVDGLISMAKDMGIEIIAEGVERQEQALYLRSKRVYLAQGYLFAPPMKVQTFLQLANALKPSPRAGDHEEEAAA